VNTPSDVSRRTLLVATAGTAAAALAGCIGAPTEHGGAATPSASAPTPDGSESDGGEDFASRSEVAALPERALDAVTVEMTMVGEKEPVFDPEVVWVNPGGTVTWKNVDEDPHSTAAYAPDNGKPRRTPDGTQGWDSGILGTGETFTQTFDAEGVYDYYCLPHESLGMVGEVVVGQPDVKNQPGLATPQDSLPGKAPAALKKLDDRVRTVLAK